MTATEPHEGTATVEAYRVPVARWKHALAGMVEGDVPESERFTGPGRDLEFREKGTALVFAIFMDRDGFTYVSLDTIAIASRQSKHTVIKYTDRLTAGGWLIRQHRGRGRAIWTYASVPSSALLDSTTPVHPRTALLTPSSAPQGSTTYAEGSSAVSGPSSAVSDPSSAPQGSTRTPGTPENSVGVSILNSEESEPCPPHEFVAIGPFKTCRKCRARPDGHKASTGDLTRILTEQDTP